MPTIHLLIKGKVQGVFYRATAKETADEIGVTGWIKNTLEGDVEAVATGSEEQLKSFTECCWKGSRRAEVAEVIATKQNEVFFKDFAVIR